MHHGRRVIQHVGAAVLADITARRTRLGFRVGHVIKVGFDRRRIERCAVGEAHILAQMEGVAQTVRRDLPTLGQPWPYLPLLVHGDQRVEVLLADKHLRHIAGYMRVKAGWFAVRGVDQGAAADGFIAARHCRGVLTTAT